MCRILGVTLMTVVIGCTSTPSDTRESLVDLSSSDETSTSVVESSLQTQIVDLSPEEFEKKLSELPDVVLIDARTAAEFATGHIPGALNIDVKSSDFKEKIQNLDPNRTYMVNCLSGIRSTRACNIMKDEGFTSLYNLKGGVRAWENAGKEVVRP